MGSMGHKEKRDWQPMIHDWGCSVKRNVITGESSWLSRYSSTKGGRPCEALYSPPCLLFKAPRIWHFSGSSQLGWGHEIEFWQMDCWCGINSRARPLRTDVPFWFPFPFPSCGDLGDYVLWIAETKWRTVDPHQTWWNWKSFSLKLLRCRDLFCYHRAQPFLVRGVELPCYRHHIQTLAISFFNTIADHAPGWYSCIQCARPINHITSESPLTWGPLIPDFGDFCSDPLGAEFTV